MSFPDGSVGKGSACNAGDRSLIPGKIHWRWDRLCTPVFLSFPCGSAVEESACNAGDLGSIPVLGRSLGEGKGYPLQYSGLENSMDYSIGYHKESDTTEQLSLSPSLDLIKLIEHFEIIESDLSQICSNF